VTSLAMLTVLLEDLSFVNDAPLTGPAQEETAVVLESLFSVEQGQFELVCTEGKHTTQPIVMLLTLDVLLQPLQFDFSGLPL
jgi:hypothetical protein